VSQSLARIGNLEQALSAEQEHHKKTGHELADVQQQLKVR
jgi:hypothetical protein